MGRMTQTRTMSDIRTVGDLKELIEGLPDSTKATIARHEGDRNEMPTYSITVEMQPTPPDRGGSRPLDFT